VATLYVEEYAGVAAANSASGSALVTAQAPAEPQLVSQTVVIGVSSTQSNAFNAKTVLVRIHTDSICSINFGTNPTAAATNKRLAANQTEYFGVPLGQSYIVAVITNT
jgi:hypothetical protein